MNVVKSELVIPFDVDETLLLEPKSFRTDHLLLSCPYDGSFQERLIHEEHVKLLKDKKARGYTIIVWSARGHAWAEAAVKALELEAHVDYIMTKPNSYVDDLDVGAWMPYRIYIQP